MPAASPSYRAVFSDGPLPRYAQLADVLRGRIERGVWRTGQRLPSLDALADGEGRPAQGYRFARRLHSRDCEAYCVSSIYLDARTRPSRSPPPTPRCRRCWAPR